MSLKKFNEMNEQEKEALGNCTCDLICKSSRKDRTTRFYYLSVHLLENVTIRLDLTEATFDIIRSLRCKDKTQNMYMGLPILYRLRRGLRPDGSIFYFAEFWVSDKSKKCYFTLFLRDEVVEQINICGYEKLLKIVDVENIDSDEMVENAKIFEIES